MITPMDAESEEVVNSSTNKRKIKGKHKQVIRENSMPASISKTNEIKTVK